jgi:hypothetical protein
MHVFHVGKRNPPYQHWEPIYIGTHQDPLYDERLSWEGRSDKMTQVNYTFIFLNDLFLYLAIDTVYGKLYHNKQ